MLRKCNCILQICLAFAWDANLYRFHRYAQICFSAKIAVGPQPQMQSNLEQPIICGFVSTDFQKIQIRTFALNLLCFAMGAKRDELPEYDFVVNLQISFL